MQKTQRDKLKTILIECKDISIADKLELINALESQKTNIEIIDIFSAVFGIIKLLTLLED